MPGYLRDWLAVLADGLGAFTPAELRYAFTKHKATSEFMPNMSNIVTLVKLKREADRDAADINRTAKLIAELKAARLDAQRPERQEETKQLMDALKAKIFGATNSEYSGA